MWLLRLLASVYDLLQCSQVCKILVEWIFLCLFILLTFNNLWHRSQFSICKSMLWVLVCSFKFWGFTKLFWHCSQEYCLTSEWVITCVFIWTFWENLVPHSEHSNGFFPSCTTEVCFCKVSLRLNFLSHCVHGKGFSPVWTNSCVWRCIFWEKCFSHFKHLNFLIPSCLVSCRWRQGFVLNDLPHFIQLKGFIWVCVFKWFFRPIL